MKKTILVLLLCISTQAAATASTPSSAYLKRFKTFLYWTNNLPLKADDDFLAFIDEDKPLAKKLRERWLYLMASRKDWATFRRHYKASQDPTLQCFYNRAEFLEGNKAEALKGALSVWASAESSPKACEPVLDFLIHSDYFNDKIVSERLALALDHGHVSLARYLLHLYKIPRREEVQLLSTIHQSPAKITQLKPGRPLHDLFYLYGLKRMVTTRASQASKQWASPQTKQILNEAQQQSFIAHMALYQALRKQKEAETWFGKLKPQYYNDTLLEWKIRAALHQQNWPLVVKMVPQMKDAENPCWQYWLARALEKGPSAEKAQAIYQKLAKNRQYYGFLAAMRLHKNPSFNQENSVNNPKLLSAYKPFLDEIKSLYNHKQTQAASRLLNDFVLELPKDEKSALLHWIGSELQWHGKSVNLAEDEALVNQLSLRFPLPYQTTLQQLAKQHKLPLALLYAVMRQESGFREEVVSGAGARGLMQLMPATARLIAAREKIVYTNKDQLFLPLKNIAIGTAYLRNLSTSFSSNIVFMAAAYNAGPRMVHYWLKDNRPQEMDIWIETLPWRETRNYLKNVVAFYAVYQYRMQHKSDLDFSLKLV